MSKTFFKKPTKSQLQEIGKFKDSPNLRPNTVEAMKVLDKKWERNSNELIRMINNTKLYHLQRDLIPGI